LIMQVSSKNIWITDNVIGFFNFLKKYQSELSTFTTGLSKQLSLEKWDDVWKLQNIGLLILSELKLIEIWNSHLLDYSKLNTAQEVRDKYIYQLNLMNSWMSRVEWTKFDKDKRFMFLKENYSVHKAKMFLQFCNIMDDKKINNKYIWVDLHEAEDQFILSTQEKKDKISSENCLIFRYSALLNKQGLSVDYRNVEEVIIDLINRVNNRDAKLEKLMNIVFYIYAYWKISDENILEKLSWALYSRQFDKKEEYGMYIEWLRIIEFAWRKKADLENIKMKQLHINEELQKIATTDPLTGLKNRWEIDHQLKIRYNYVNRESITSWYIIFDLDGFKRINDNLGHSIWDKVLVELSKILQSHFKRPEDVMARFGWDEFVLILDGKKEVIEKMLNKLWGDLLVILNNISEVRWFNDKIENQFNKIKLSVSMWVMQIDDNISIRDLMIESDVALYNVKNDWKNWYMFSWEKSQSFEDNN
jgi:diguanylate cyclase (GGDEF)-like protein